MPAGLVISFAIAGLGCLFPPGSAISIRRMDSGGGHAYT